MQQQKSLRIGIAAILCALVMRFFSPELLRPLIDFLTEPDTVAFLIYAETGRRVRFSPDGELLREQVPEARLTFAPESPDPELPQWVMPVFSDASQLELYNNCSFQPELEPLLREPLSWNLQDGVPRVLIYHTHTTESYRKYRQDYEETAPYRTLDPHYNVLSVGNRVAELLEQAGISVIHDREFHDYPSYNASYLHSRKAEAELLRQYPDIVLALDIHRDAIEGPQGQIKTAANVGGQTAAQLMIVVGTDCNLPHKHWRQNLALGLKLQAQLQQQTPGIVRPLNLRPQRFNQDLSPGGLLIEVGAAGNSQAEALLAAEQLAEAIIALSRGTGPTEDWADWESDLPAVPAADF